MPDLILREATYTFGQPDRNPLTLNAEEISIWQDTRTAMKKVVFNQNDELTGTCDEATSSDNKRVNLKGNVKLSKVTDNVKIECDSLNWDDDTQTISSDGLVSLVYKDGTEITAEGFSALLEENKYEFKKIVEGRYTADEE